VVGKKKEKKKKKKKRKKKEKKIDDFHPSAGGIRKPSSESSK